MKNRLDRRTVLASLAAASGAGIASNCAPLRSSDAPVRPPLGLTDLTIMKALKQDYAATLKGVAAMGYTHFGFRLAGYALEDKSELPPQAKAQMVHDSGLKLGVVRYGYGQSFVEQARAAQSIGAGTIAYSASPVLFRNGKLGQASRAQFDAWLPELRDMARIAQDLGLTLAYHNHWWDHVPLDGETPLNIIARSFSPKDVAFEIDLAWAWIGGADPLQLITQLGTRVVSMHFKDVDPALGSDYLKQLVEPGAGKMNYAALLPRLDGITNAIGYVEVDAPADGMVSAAAAARVIHDIRGVGQ